MTFLNRMLGWTHIARDLRAQLRCKLLLTKTIKRVQWHTQLVQHASCSRNCQHALARVLRIAHAWCRGNGHMALFLRLQLALRRMLLRFKMLADGCRWQRRWCFCRQGMPQGPGLLQQSKCRSCVRVRQRCHKHLDLMLQPLPCRRCGGQRGRWPRCTVPQSQLSFINAGEEQRHCVATFAALQVARWPPLAVR
jgi:hypothetical protein